MELKKKGDLVLISVYMTYTRIVKISKIHAQEKDL